MNIYKDLETITNMALENATNHDCNYTIILLNPDKNGEFDIEKSTYEFVRDSYFNTFRQNVKILKTTDEIFYKNNQMFNHQEEFKITNPYLNFDKEIYAKPFVKKVPVRTEKKINRNETCPCLSGKKYKNCCIK